ncbi:MAG: hypothetical protein R3C49_27280 [Planctomycetaceae bacterium]
MAITVLARLFIGWLCDRVGPRIAYTWLLILGSLPVMGIGFAHDFQTFSDLSSSHRSDRSFVRDHSVSRR